MAEERKEHPDWAEFRRTGDREALRRILERLEDEPPTEHDLLIKRILQRRTDLSAEDIKVLLREQLGEKPDDPSWIDELLNPVDQGDE